MRTIPLNVVSAYCAIDQLRACSSAMSALRSQAEKNFVKELNQRNVEQNKKSEFIEDVISSLSCDEGSIDGFDDLAKNDKFLKCKLVKGLDGSEIIKRMNIAENCLWTVALKVAGLTILFLGASTIGGALATFLTFKGMITVAVGIATLFLGYDLMQLGDNLKVEYRVKEISFSAIVIQTLGLMPTEKAMDDDRFGYSINALIKGTTEYFGVIRWLLTNRIEAGKVLEEANKLMLESQKWLF